MTSSSSPRSATGRPVVVNQVDAEVGASLRAHPAEPVVIDLYDAETPPWELPEETEVLVTRPSIGWRKAPQEAAALPAGLRWVQTLSAGVEIYPRWLMDGRAFTCGRGVAAGAIAEYVMAALLDHAKGFRDLVVRDEASWKTRPEIGSLSGKTLGLLGYGAINQAIARRAQGFEMTVLASRRGAWDASDTLAAPAASPEALFAASDYLVVGMPLTDATRHMVNAALLAAAKPGLVLINVARGEIVDQEALCAALEAGQLGRAVLDVTTPEPLPDGHPLYAQAGVTITPHISWVSPDFMAGFLQDLGSNLSAYMAGAPLMNLVDTDRGY
ncbi:NAD(P)-dependent oxidoreductase [Pseudodonghicola flavimaris]|uniref:NAD(P)-dependent oxidoreductase n=1 Tax=Pseudodonghicola flavimaris TaxID=3050036 RepID=A0ABT7F3A3_9RHOB|nr:NAD(P)-dependent oxidoreductase [Pseudodonghicola flavimaris]MDK3018914.1 NAD(P)-dependent oxidoreductase [Pseudodonghicola flavimaris]